MIIHTQNDATIEHMGDPQYGNRFHELLSFWVHVVGRDGDRVAVREYHPPCDVPADGKLRLFQTVAAFQQAYAYKEIAGYWITYADDKAEDWEPQEFVKERS